MWNYNGKVIREGRAWTDDDGTQHPANWNIWSADEKISKGLVWVDVQPQPDGRFYWFSQNADGTYTTTPRELEDRNEVDQNGDPIIDPRTGKQMVTLGLKSQAVAQTKQTQGSLLSQTDWAYIRKQDTGIVVFKETFIFSGVNTVNIYFRFYAGPKSWTIVFKHPNNSYCTSSPLNGTTIEPPQIQNKDGINV
jgi:hypothetical protein